MNELALFAGAGGGILGTRLLGWRVVCAVENDAFRREVLLRRQEDGLIEPFPVWDDVRTFTGDHVSGQAVDVVTGGDPCQANSNASRNGSSAVSLAGEFIRVVEEVSPTYVIRENPACVRKDAPWPADRFALGLERLGYATVCVEIRACCLGADHQRARMFVLGVHPNTYGQPNLEALTRALSVGEAERSARRSARRDANRLLGRVVPRVPRLLSEADVCRVSDDVPYRVERARALGDTQVPIVVRAVGELLR